MCVCKMITAGLEQLAYFEWHVPDDLGRADHRMGRLLKNREKIFFLNVQRHYFVSHHEFKVKLHFLYVDILARFIYIYVARFLYLARFSRKSRYYSYPIIISQKGNNVNLFFLVDILARFLYIASFSRKSRSI